MPLLVLPVAIGARGARHGLRHATPGASGSETTRWTQLTGRLTRNRLILAACARRAAVGLPGGRRHIGSRTLAGSAVLALVLRRASRGIPVLPLRAVCALPRARGRVGQVPSRGARSAAARSRIGTLVCVGASCARLAASRALRRIAEPLSSGAGRARVGARGAPRVGARAGVARLARGLGGCPVEPPAGRARRAAGRRTPRARVRVRAGAAGLAIRIQVMRGGVGRSVCVEFTSDAGGAGGLAGDVLVVTRGAHGAGCLLVDRAA